MEQYSRNYYRSENVKVKAKGYLEKDKEKLQQQVQNCYKNLSEEEKDRKRGYGTNQYKIYLNRMNKNLKRKHKDYEDTR